MRERIQELEAKLREMGDGDSTERVDVLIELAKYHISGDDPPRLAQIAQEMNEISERLGYARGQGYGALYESLNCCFIASHQRGLDRVDEARARLDDLGDRMGVHTAELLKANILRSIGSYDQSLPLMYASLEYFLGNGKDGWAAGCYYDLGLLYQEIGDYAQAFKSHEQCVALLEHAPDAWGIEARALNGIGRALNKMARFEEALDYHHRSLAQFRELGHEAGEARALEDIGSIYLDRGDHKLALPFHEKSLEIRRRIGLRRAECTSLLNVARVHVGMKNDSSALYVLKDALTIAEETNSKALVYDAHSLFSKAYELKGDYKRALQHLQDSRRIREDVFSENAADKIRKLQIGFEVQKSEQAAELTRQKNKELEEKNRSLEALLHELRATQSQLVQAEKMAAIGKLVAGMVHEMNTPLGASNSAIDVSERAIRKIAELMDKGGTIERAHGIDRLLEHVRANQQITREANERMSRTLANLKSFIRLDSSERAEVDINAELDRTIALLDNDHKDRIKITKEYGKLPRVHCWPGEINQVFMSILANAAEAIEGKGEIRVRTRQKDGRVLVAIADTGAGIPEEDIAHLFDPGFSTKGRRVKAGMGLLVSLNIVRKHGGRIDVESAVGKGTTFKLTIPCVQQPRGAASVHKTRD